MRLKGNFQVHESPHADWQSGPIPKGYLLLDLFAQESVQYDLVKHNYFQLQTRPQVDVSTQGSLLVNESRPGYSPVYKIPQKGSSTNESSRIDSKANKGPTKSHIGI